MLKCANLLLNEWYCETFRWSKQRNNEVEEMKNQSILPGDMKLKNSLMTL